MTFLCKCGNTCNDGSWDGTHRATCHRCGRQWEYQRMEDGQDWVEVVRSWEDRCRQAERERDEARADHRRSMHAAIEQRERLAQATALLREWRDAYEHEDNGTWLARCSEVRDRAGAFLAGQPAPGSKPVVDDAMVERLRYALLGNGVVVTRSIVRAALVAALEGRK